MTRWTVLYRVQRSSPRELVQVMKRIGPLDDGEHWAARTWSKFYWKYPFERSADGCRTGPVSVEVEIQQIFPSWVSQGDANAAAAREWARWSEATRAHEDGHCEISAATATRIWSELSTLGTKNTCEEVDRTAYEIGDTLLRHHQDQHSAYDRGSATACSPAQFWTTRAEPVVMPSSNA